MLGWVVVWYYAPHHIGGGIVCSLLLIVCLGAHSWQCPLALALGMCACALAHGIVSSLTLARGILCARARARSRLYVASYACTAVTTQRCCCTNCTSCHMQTIYVEQWNHRVFVMISYNNIMRAHKDKTEFWCFPRSFLVYLKPWYCFYIRLKYQRLRGKKARQTSKP